MSSNSNNVQHLNKSSEILNGISKTLLETLLTQ